MFSFQHNCSLQVSRILRRNSLQEFQIVSIYPWSYLRLCSICGKTQETPVRKREVHGFSLFFHLVLHAQGLTFMSEYPLYVFVYLLIIYRFKPVPNQERCLASDHYLRFLQNKVPYKLQQKIKGEKKSSPALRNTSDIPGYFQGSLLLFVCLLCFVFNIFFGGIGLFWVF